ncbi:MAG: MBL fold metallo-hydrolase [Actinobacteria bacterium]|nr:MBL fold metallo-hydrolase [Actinomycetota bacterium]
MRCGRRALSTVPPVRVTVLGKSPSWQDAGGACSGYLLQQGDTNVLLDCGNGVFGKLRERISYTEIDAVLISHLHADHFLDLVPFSYALGNSLLQQPVPVHSHQGTDSPARPRLIAPAGAGQVFRRVVGAWGGETLIEDSFALEEYAPGEEVTVGPIKAGFHPVPHFIDTFAVSLSSGESKVTYSADTRPGPEIVEIARDADLLIVEATLDSPEPEGDRGHMTPAEAGEQARLAGAKRVVLTHISDELDPDWAREQASAAFGAPVELAREFEAYEV